MKSILITGAYGGMGKETAELLAKKGFKVFAHYVYKGFELTDAAKAIGAYKPHTQRISLGIQYIIPVL